MRNTTTLFLSASLLLLASCWPPEFLHALSDPTRASADAQLNGVWRRHEPGETDDMYLHIASRKGKRGHDVVITVHDEDGIESYAFRMFPTKLKSGTYLNIQERTSFRVRHGRGVPEYASPYFIMRYAVDGDSLVLDYMDTEVLEKSILAKGKLKGVESTSDKPAEVTSNRSDVVRVIESIPKRKKLFDHWATFKKDS